jgi:hypothetical protein
MTFTPSIERILGRHFSLEAGKAERVIVGAYGPVPKDSTSPQIMPWRDCDIGSG